MATLTSPDAPPQCETIELTGDHQLTIERRASDSVLQIVSPGGQVALTIELTSDGPILRFDGLNMRIESSGDLAIGARRLALHGREAVSITTEGDAGIRAEGDLTTEARVQNISARLGNVNVKANDDVRLRGERVRLNC
jgi:hypothetical protein